MCASDQIRSVSVCLVTSNSCDSIDCSLPGASVHGILQARRGLLDTYILYMLFLMATELTKSKWLWHAWCLNMWKKREKPSSSLEYLRTRRQLNILAIYRKKTCFFFPFLFPDALILKQKFKNLETFWSLTSERILVP